MQVPFPRPRDQHLLREPLAAFERILFVPLRSECVAVGKEPGLRGRSARRLIISAADEHKFAVQSVQGRGGVRRFDTIYGCAESSPALATPFPEIRPSSDEFARHELDDGQPSKYDPVTRIARKLRRIEQRLFLEEQAGQLEVNRIPEAERAFVSNSQALRQPAKHPSIDLNSRVHIARPQPVVDVVQITDEVVKQLDRRVIAARERRGRI